ncbi:MAG TPA: hypothetical protein VGK84_07335, partial [Candidatus Tumulicola sp.]
MNRFRSLTNLGVFAAMLSACSANGSADKTITVPPAQPPPTRAAASGKHGGPTLYVLNSAYQTRVQTVTVYGSAGSKLLRTIPSPTNTFGFNDMTTDAAGHLFLAYETAGTQHRRQQPGFLRVYTDQAAHALQTLKQPKPFMHPAIDALGNLLTMCATKRICEYAAGEGSKVVKQDIIRRIALSKVKPNMGATGFSSDSTGDIAVNQVYDINVFAPGQTTPYWTITAGPDCYFSGTVFDSKGDLYAACSGEDYSGAILEYGPGQSQNPFRTLYGPNGVADVTGIKLDSADNVYALNDTGIGWNVIVF